MTRVNFLPGLAVLFASSIAAPGCLSSPAIEGKVAKDRLTWLNAQVQRHPSDPKVYIERAKFWYEFDALLRARADLAQSLKLHPTAMAYLWLGKATMSPPENKETLKYFAQARATADDFLTLADLGNAYGGIRAYEKADEAYDAALKMKHIAPGFENIIYAWKANNLLKASQFDKALTAASYVLTHIREPVTTERALNDHPDVMQKELRTIYISASKTRALSYLGMHDYKKAEGAFDSALKFLPHDDVLLKGRVEVLEKLGKKSLAARARAQIKEENSFLFDNAPFSEK